MAPPARPLRNQDPVHSSSGVGPAAVGIAAPAVGGTVGRVARKRGTVAEALQRLRQLGRTVLLIDHDPGFVVNNCDRAMATNFGEVLHIGTPDHWQDACGPAPCT